jgi:ribosomal protein S18 acetylase RimI-like enzyme
MLAKKDYKELNWVNEQTWLHTYPNAENNITLEDIKNLPWTKFEEDWRTKLASVEEGLYYFTAKIDSKIVGFIVMKELAEFIAIGSIYVLPNYQNLGIGSGLVNHTLKFVSKQKPIVVKVAEYNQNSINFYKKLGFIFVEKVVNFKLSEEKSIPQIKMVWNR